MKKYLSLFTLLPLFSFLALKQKSHQTLNVVNIDKDMAYIAGGSIDTLVLEGEGKNRYYKRQKVKTISSFYIYRYEVSNYFYRQFIFDACLKDETLYDKLLPDTLVWKKKLRFCEPYVANYFRHPAYSDYPVVGVSYEQCELFCKWLTEKYNTRPKRKFKRVSFKLPSRDQWYFSACAELADKKEKRYVNSFRLFPDGRGLRNSKGESLANYKEIEQGDIMRANAVVIVEGKENPGTYYLKFPGNDMNEPGTLNTYENMTAPINAYWPNVMGLYNMAGNVEEFVREKGITKGGSWNDTGYYLRNDVEEKYDSTNYVTSSRGFRFVMEVEELK